MRSVKKFICMTISEFSKVIMSKNFYLAIVLTVLAFLTQQIHTDLDGKSYNVLEAYFGMTDEYKVEYAHDICREHIFDAATKEGVIFFASVLTVIPIVSIIATERKKDRSRFVIGRVGVTPYILSKLLTSMLIGGMVICIGLAIFYIIVNVGFPSNEEGAETVNMAIIMGYGCTIKQIFVGHFIFGIVTALLGFICASLTCNEYLVYSIPFILSYITDMLLINLSQKYNNYESNVVKFIQALELRTLLSISVKDSTQKMYCMLIVGVLVVIGYLSWRVSYALKHDTGKE